jgi:hypothetical protein
MTKDDQFLRWVLGHLRFPVSDIELVTMFHTQLRTDQTGAQMFVKTDTARKRKEGFESYNRPDSPCQLTPAMAIQADKQIMTAVKGILPFTPAKDCVTTPDPYLPVRFFLIALAGALPLLSMRPEVSARSVNCIFDESEPVAAAAMEIPAAWLLKIESPVPDAAAHRAEGRAVYPRSQGACCTFLHRPRPSRGLYCMRLATSISTPESL